jgi:hypothetical protein
MVEYIKILACIVGTFYLATLIDYYVKIWQSREIKETNEGPHFYITKEL